MDYIDYGLGLFARKTIADWPEEAFDLADVYAKLAEQGRLAGYEVSSVTEFGESGVAPEELGEMAAMCPWPVKSSVGSASLQEAGFPHGDRA